MTPAYPAPTPRVAHDCGSCDGAGATYESVRWAGEAYGELVEHPCHDCNGTGIDGDECAYCGDETCDCADEQLVAVERIAPGRIAASIILAGLAVSTWLVCTMPVVS